VSAEHVTVLLQEAVDALAVKPDGIYVDGTFGRGGHSRLILQHLGSNGQLIVFDKDPQAIVVANQLAQEDKRICVVHAGFASLSEALNELGVEKVDGVLLDLGISSPQIDQGERGFSFRFDAPLDMRMDTSRGQTAQQWLSEADEAEIREVIKNYGEERFNRQIAAAIVARRSETPIGTTSELAELVAKVVRTREPGQHPATRTFQAIRIFINRELDELQEVLPQAAQYLKEGGRLAIISFHSLEDRMVKQFFRAYSQKKALPKWAVLKESEREEPPLTLVGKAIAPDVAEISANPRSRSARLRVAQRGAAKWASDE
jgi:16S rRNA (cytosine1402-N4)-methyltransferase